MVKSPFGFPSGCVTRRLATIMPTASSSICKLWALALRHQFNLTTSPTFIYQLHQIEFSNLAQDQNLGCWNMKTFGELCYDTHLTFGFFPNRVPVIGLSNSHNVTDFHSSPSSSSHGIRRSTPRQEITWDPTWTSTRSPLPMVSTTIPKLPVVTPRAPHGGRLNSTRSPTL